MVLYTVLDIYVRVMCEYMVNLISRYLLQIKNQMLKIILGTYIVHGQRDGYS